MSVAELSFLILVIVAFSGFAISLGFVTWWSRRR